MAEEKFSQLVKARNFVVKIRVETGGRKGKTVTLLDGLPKNELFLKELLKSLKQACGAGGTYHMDKKDGVIEVQGDHRDRVGAFLAKHEIKVAP